MGRHVMAAWRSRALSVGFGLGEWTGKAFDDGHGLHADLHDTAERRDQIARILEPAVRIVDDTAVPVPRDPVAVDEPFDRSAPVDLIVVRLRRNPGKAEVVVDDQDAPVVISSAANGLRDPVAGTQMARLSVSGDGKMLSC